MNGFYPRVIEKLKAAGYSYSRPGKGSHEFWTNGRREQLVSCNIDSRHTANGIMKQAGIAHKF